MFIYNYFFPFVFYLLLFSLGGINPPDIVFQSLYSANFKICIAISFDRFKLCIFSRMVCLLPYSWNAGWLSTNRKINPIYPHRVMSILCPVPSITTVLLYNVGCLSHIVGLILISTFLTLILIFLNLLKSIFKIPFSFLIRRIFPPDILFLKPFKPLKMAFFSFFAVKTEYYPH